MICAYTLVYVSDIRDHPPIVIAEKKRAPSAYNLYMREHLKQYRESHPGTSVKDAMKEASKPSIRPSGRLQCVWAMFAHVGRRIYPYLVSDS